ncbi:MAG: hypothetical protein KAT00_00195 [Planctomycetes bacterium]|nr:hypothetical protein [Planctomycetota bacterium]
MSIENAILKLAEAIQNLADSNAGNTTLHTTVTADAVEAVTAAVEVEKTEAKTPEKKAPKKAAAKKKVEPVEDDDDELDEPVKAKTLDDVKEAALALRDGVDRAALTKALKTFKATKMSELAPENYGAFIRHCDDTIENADVGE